MTAATTTQLNAEIAARKAADTALAARVTKLETSMANVILRVAAVEAKFAPPITPPVPPPVTPPPPPSGPWTWASLQAAINGTAAGGTINATGQTFHELPTINKSLTLIGGTVDATGLGVALQDGALTISAPHVNVSGLRATGSAGAGIAIHGTSDVQLTDCELDNNIQEGYSVQASQRVTFLRTHIHHNNVALSVDPGWEAGGGKSTTSSAVLFDACEADHNVGPGIWFDVQDTGVEVRNCKVHDNLIGIMFETCTGALIHDNVVWANMTPDGWFWAAGILISSAANAEVYGNTVRSGATGIAVLSQNRSDAPLVTGNYVHDNTIVMDAKDPANTGEWAAIAFAQDWAGTLEKSGNRSASNHFWFPSAEPSWNRFGQWGGNSLDTLAKLNAASLTTAPNNYLATAPSVP